MSHLTDIHLQLGQAFRLLAPTASVEEVCQWVCDQVLEFGAAQGCAVFLVDQTSGPALKAAKNCTLATPTSSPLALVCGGETVGLLDLVDQPQGEGAELARGVVGMIAAHAGLAIQIATLRQEFTAKLDAHKKRADRYELIHRVGQTLVEGPDLETAMQRVVEMVATQLDYSHTAVLLLDEELQELEVISAHGYGEVSGLRIPVTQGVTGYAVRYGEVVNIADVKIDPRYVRGIRRGRSELVMPLIREGKCCGAIDVESREKNAFGKDDVELLNVVAAYASASIAAARLQESLGKERALRREIQSEAKLLRSEVERQKRALAEVALEGEVVQAPDRPGEDG